MGLLAKRNVGYTTK